MDAITCGDTFDDPQTAMPRHGLGTIERAGGVPARTIMVGDSVNDILATQNAGSAFDRRDLLGYSDVARRDTRRRTRVITRIAGSCDARAR